MQNSIKEIVKGSVLGIIGKIVAAALGFISLPILLNIYGKSNYGLIGVALTTNTFLQIINMGVPTGAVKFFSQWVDTKNYTALQRGIQTNLFFFTAAGIVNSLILLYIGIHTEAYFKVSDPRALRSLIFILSFTSFFNWYFITTQHLLLANEKIGWVNLSNSVVSILNFIAVIIAYFSGISLITYFVLYSVSGLIIIPFNIIACSRFKILKASYFIPVFRKKEFRIIMGYSAGLFGMAILQYLANQSQPLILSTMNGKGDTAVANYRILQNITMLVSVVGSIFLQNFLPYVSKINSRGNESGFKKFIYDSTKWLSVLIFFVCFFIAINSKQILTIYVGEAGSGLSIWLSIWVLALLFLNNQGIGSVMLSIGKFKPIIIGLFISTAVAISFTLMFVKQFGVGVTAMSYLIYKTIEAIFIYGYYLPRVAKISSLHLINNSIKLPLLLSVFSVILSKTFFTFLPIGNNIFSLLMSGLVSFIIYAGLIWYYVIENKEKILIRGLFLKFT